MREIRLQWPNELNPFKSFRVRVERKKVFCWRSAHMRIPVRSEIVRLGRNYRGVAKTQGELSSVEKAILDTSMSD